MSQEPTRQSQRIRDPSYRRRTTWSLPEIVSVGLYISGLVLMLICFCSCKGVRPTTFNRDETHHEDAMTSTASSVMARAVGNDVGRSYIFDVDDDTLSAIGKQMFRGYVYESLYTNV